MPLYNSPLTRPQLLQKGVPAYLFGGLNMLQGNARGYVVDTALTGTGALATAVIDAAGTGYAANDTVSVAGGTGGVVKILTVSGGVPQTISILTAGQGYSPVTGAATTAIIGSGTGLTVTTTVTSANSLGSVTVQINEGPIPKVSDLITVWGTSQQTGAFNVTRALITAVSITAATGQGTISFALTGSNQSVTADAGAFLTEPGESYDTLTNSTFSQAVLVQAPQGDSQFTLPLAVTFSTIPTAVTATLQVAIRDVAAEYTNTTTVVTVAAGAYTAGPVVQATLQRGYFYRLAVSGLTIGSGSGICAKVG